MRSPSEVKGKSLAVTYFNFADLIVKIYLAIHRYLFTLSTLFKQKFCAPCFEWTATSRGSTQVSLPRKHQRRKSNRCFTKRRCDDSIRNTEFCAGNQCLSHTTRRYSKPRKSSLLETDETLKKKKKKIDGFKQTKTLIFCCLSIEVTYHCIHNDMALNHVN